MIGARPPGSMLQFAIGQSLPALVRVRSPTPQRSPMSLERYHLRSGLSSRDGRRAEPSSLPGIVRWIVKPLVEHDRLSRVEGGAALEGVEVEVADGGLR